LYNTLLFSPQTTSKANYLLAHFGKETLLISILQNHAQLVSVSEASVHFQHVGMVHEQLQFDFFDELRFHIFFSHLLQINHLQSENHAGVLLFCHEDRTKAATT
jgi:hypothetical protein